MKTITLTPQDIEQLLIKPLTAFESGDLQALTDMIDQLEFIAAQLRKNRNVHLKALEPDTTYSTVAQQHNKQLKLIQETSHA